MGKVMNVILVYGLVLAIGCATLPPMTENPQEEFPRDFRIEVLTGGLHPWEESDHLTIDASGHGHLKTYVPEDVGVPPLKECRFQLSNDSLEELWTMLRDQGFFALETEIQDEEVEGGLFLTVSVTAHDKTHRVNSENTSVPQLSAVMDLLEEILPSDCRPRGYDV
jgi:hypothetical protein